jgi:LDH2 family malate/lactate/ureidoglycolate dehydrogenase
MPTTTPASTADILAWADLHGIESHGISTLFEYDDRRKTRPVNFRPEPRILLDTPVAALTDAGGGLGHRVLPTGGVKGRRTNFWSFAAPSGVAETTEGTR